MTTFFKVYGKYKILLILILFLAIFLRIYKLQDNLFFNAELGGDYLAIKNFINLRQIPLLGPPSSHTWLWFGPLYYWLFGPIFAIFEFNPVFGGYFFAFLGSLLVIENYIFLSRLFNKNVAIVSSFLISVSPSLLSLTRESRFISLTVFFFYPFIYFFVQFIKKANLKSLFWSGFFVGLMTEFHYSNMVIVFSGLLIILIYTKRINVLLFKDIFIFITAVLLANFPFIVYNFQHRFDMFFKFIVWFPYRVAGFFGVVPKNNFSLYIIYSDFASFFTFVSRSFSPNFLIGLLISIVSIIILIKSNYFKAKTRGFLRILALLFLFSVIAIFIHGDPPYHYFLPVYLMPIIFISDILVHLSEKYGKPILIYFLSILTLVNFVYYFSDKWFFKMENMTIGEPILYKLQLEVVRAILNDAKGSEFSLSRVGQYDQFVENFSQNYRFLLWRMGNEPVIGSKLVYTIYEEKSRFYPTIYEKVISTNDIIVTRKEVK